MKKAVIKNEKIVNIDLHILKKANENEWERYNAVLVLFSEFLFQESAGTWGGRESLIDSQNTNDNTKIKTNYWLVLESKQTLALEKIKKMVDNFNIFDCVEITMGEAFETKEDYKKEFEEGKKLTWVYWKNKK